MPQLDLKKIEPDNFNPLLQVMSWADILPTFNLPAGKEFVLGKGPDWTHDKVLSRGMTCLQHNDVSGISEITLNSLKDAGKIYHSVPITPELFGIGASGPNEWVGTFPDMYNRLYWPSGLPTYEQAFEIGNNCDISHRVTVGETMENTHYTNPRGQHFNGYYERKSQRMDEKWGPGNWLMAHDYLFINMGPDWHYITEAQAKDIFRNPTSVANYDYTTGSLKRINLFCAGGYLAGPDRDNRYVFDLALKSRMYDLLGKKCVLYWDPEREWMPNMKTAQRAPEGVLYKEGKMPTPPTITAGLVIAGLHFGAGFIGWNSMGKIINKIWSTYWMEQLFNGSFYVKNNETLERGWQEWPYLSGNMSYTFVSWASAVNIAAFAAKAYADTFGQVAGGTIKPAKYKINNNAWYNPFNTYQDDLCYAKYNSAPIVETQMVAGKEAVLYLEPTANNQKKMVTVEGQTGVQHTFEVCGNIPHVGVANI